MPRKLEVFNLFNMRASTGGRYSSGYVAFTSGVLLASCWSIVWEQCVLPAELPTSHPSAFSCLPSSCALCPTLFTLWALPGSQLGCVASGPIWQSVKEKGRNSAFDMLPKEGDAQICFEIFVPLSYSRVLSCCTSLFFFSCCFALISLLWRDRFTSSLDSYILFVLLADPINTHFSVIFKL